jgi:hypothetical protein
MFMVRPSIFLLTCEPTCTQVLSTALSMLKAIQAKITAKMTSKPVGADDADLDRLRSSVFCPHVYQRTRIARTAKRPVSHSN